MAWRVPLLNARQWRWAFAALTIWSERAQGVRGAPEYDPGAIRNLQHRQVPGRVALASSEQTILVLCVCVLSSSGGLSDEEQNKNQEAPGYCSLVRQLHSKKKSELHHEYRRATRRCRPKVKRIGTHGFLNFRSAMPWRLTQKLASSRRPRVLSSRLAEALLIPPRPTRPKPRACISPTRFSTRYRPGHIASVARGGTDTCDVFRGRRGRAAAPLHRRPGGQGGRRQPVNQMKC